MKISTRVSGSYVILSILVLFCGGSGLYGVSQLSNSLVFITGAAWNTADGAMEGSIGVEAQMIAVNKIVHKEISLAEGKRALEDGQEMADESLGRMSDSGLVSRSDVASLDKVRQEFRSTTDELLTTFDRFDRADQQLSDNFFNFQKFMEDAEEIGDGAVEDLENNPGRKISWNSGLKEKWTAADGTMESQIGMLQRIYYYELLTGGGDIESSKGHLIDSLDFMNSSMDEIVVHSLFKKLKVSDSNRSYADTLRDHRIQHGKDFTAAIAAYEVFAKNWKAYNKIADELLEILEAVEDAGDKKVEGEQDNIDASIATSYTLVLIAVGLSLGVAIIGGIWIVNSIISPLKSTVDAMTDISEGEGDLTLRLASTGNDELGDLSNSFNRFTERMQEVMASVKEASGTIENGAKEISTGNMDLSQRTQEQASSLEEVASNVEELTSTVQQNADSAQKAFDLATKNRQQAETGIKVISETSSAMQEVNSASDEIVDIIATIESIAFQTNLLALNAAVEAARAGDEGRGFAVVASEVRTLAQRTSEAANSIKNLIENTVSKVRHSTELAEQSGQVFEKITEDVKQMLDQVSEINHASKEQSAGIDQINQAINLLEQMTQQNSALVEEAAAASGLMSDESQKMAELMSYFKVGNESTLAASRKVTAKQALSTPVHPVATAANRVKSTQTAGARPLKTTKDTDADEWTEF